MSADHKRVTVYLKPAETEYSVSDLVNSAIGQAVLEDAVDLEAFEKSSGEPLLLFEDVVSGLKKERGKAIGF